MAYALVAGQTVSALSGFSTSPTTVTLPNNPTQNNLVVVFVSIGGTGVTVIDGNSNSYTATASTPFAGSSKNLGIWYLVAPANASKSITVSVSSPSNFTEVFAGEFSGGATASVFESDATVAFGSPFSTNISTPSITTTNNGDLIIGCAGGFDTITSINSPWTAMGAIVATAAASFFVQSTAGAQAVNFTQNSSTSWDGISAAFKAGSGAASFVPYNPWPQAGPMLAT